MSIKGGDEIMLQPDYWKFDHDTVMMILENYQELSTGAKLESPDGFDNPETKGTGVGHHGWFEGSCMLAAEVARRVWRCGKDGMIVEERFGLRGWDSPKSEELISQKRSIPIEDIQWSIDRVTFYITGRIPRWETTEKRKGIEYQDWVVHGWRPKPRILPRHNIRVSHG
jgi:hypothetical protein